MCKKNIEYIYITDTTTNKCLINIEINDENLEIDTYFSNILNFLHKQNRLVFVDGEILLKYHCINKFDDLFINLRSRYLRHKKRDKIKEYLEKFVSYFPELKLKFEK